MFAMRQPWPRISISSVAHGLGVSVLLLLVGPFPTGAQQPAYDILIRGGKIIDGTGNPWFYGDVAVSGGKIVAVGRVPAGRARREIDASGLVVAPGFIDMHSHSDTVLLEDGLAQSKIRQGVTTEVLDDVGQELPRIDDRQVGRVHRYGYAMEISSEWAIGNGLRKHDLVAGKVERHDGNKRALGEPIFIPASPDAGEDEGWVLTVAYDPAADASQLLVIDATDFTAPPVATVHLRRRVPFGFHGIWLQGGSLG